MIEFKVEGDICTGKIEATRADAVAEFAYAMSDFLEQLLQDLPSQVGVDTIAKMITGMAVEMYQGEEGKKSGNLDIYS